MGCAFSRKVAWVWSEQRRICSVASALPFCVPASQLGMGCGFIHLNTPAAFRAELETRKVIWKCQIRAVFLSQMWWGMRKPLHFLLPLLLAGLSPLSSLLHTALLCKSGVSSVIQLNPHIRLAKTPYAFWFSDAPWAPMLLETIFRFYFCVTRCCTRNQRLWWAIIARCTTVAMFLFLIPGNEVWECLLSLACEEMQRR